jgi:hypothetical protein
LFAALILAGALLGQPVRADGPRIVNLYNFIRNSDSRLANSEAILFTTTSNQIELLRQYDLPATWALQYDALINPRYVKLLQGRLGPRDEIAAWWEIPRPLAEAAGLRWRGRFDWDWAANVGFSPGYTPVERRRLVDAYMSRFKAAFGYYPRSIGSWYIDEVTLAYLEERYGLVASCNCKDQIGTDGYTLWGGYWNQAYYPSRLNAYMPAQTRSGQIDMPVFRMLGSDPIYQHGTTPGMYTLEPVYSSAGGSPTWVDWFMRNLIHGPCLAFGYTQAGQENSFGWEAMKDGLRLQAQLLAAESKAGEIKLQTLAESGAWFRHHFTVTPPTAMVYLDDWKQEGRQTVWYDSRFYRVNFLWQEGELFVRDLHRFDQSVSASTHEVALTNTSLAYETLPVVDVAMGASTAQRSGMKPVRWAADGGVSALKPAGAPIVRESSRKELSIQQPLLGGGTMAITCGEGTLTGEVRDGQGRPVSWAWELSAGTGSATVLAVTPEAVKYRCAGVDYELRLARRQGTCEAVGAMIRIHANAAGKVVLRLDNPRWVLSHTPPEWARPFPLARCTATLYDMLPI